MSRLGQYAGHFAGAPVILGLLPAINGHLDPALDLGQVAQTISLATHALGLASCRATLYPDGNAAEASRILGLEQG